MKKFIIVTTSEQAVGYRLAGIDAIGIDDINVVTRLITSWLDNKEEILLALDEYFFQI